MHCIVGPHIFTLYMCGPEVLFQDLHRDEIRGWWWWCFI